MLKRTKKHVMRKAVLRLPDLDHAKTSVLNSLSSPRSRRNYKFAMEQFINWHCSETRLALNRTVVLCFRQHLESLGLAAGTISQRLAAVRRQAYEAADSGLLSPELAAGIRRVKGVKQLGCRVGNWLNQDQARLLLQKANGKGLRQVRDVAMIAILLGCGLRRAELSALRREDIHIRQGHWAIVDLVGKGNHVRTVPMPGWVKNAIDRWLTAASVTTGRVFRAVSRHGTVWGNGISEKRRLVRGPELCTASGTRPPGTSRPSANLRKALLCERRRTGANTVSSRSRLRPDNRTLPRMQAEPGKTRERSLWLPVLRRCRFVIRPEGSS